MTKTRTKNMRHFGSLGKAVTVGALGFSASVIPLSQALALDDNALPMGGTVVDGSATLDYSTPSTLNVYQETNRAVIDWSTFNIGSNATTQFFQPSSQSIIVNRVTGSNQDPSQIMGSLKANGTVFVLDRNGVIFGANSQVDVGSIVVSTGTIDENAFMSGSNVISIDNIDSNSSIINNGHITVAEAGLAAFVAPTLVNNGLIEAKMGQVALASGTKATIDLYGDDLVELATDLPLDHASIQNNGTIKAEGGIVLITAEAAKNIVDSVINMAGLVDVSSVSEKGGKIIIEGANTEVSGTLDASGKTGGGTILVGGDYQGGGTVRHAEKTIITSSAKIKANTTGDHGDGGKVVVWSDDSTWFGGAIEAKGGLLSGHGGTVETSGKINLGVDGTVDAFGVDSSGEWLLDPSNVTISASSGTNISSSGGTFNPSSDSYQVSASSIQAALNLGNNVTITTTNAGGTQSGNIDFDWAGVTINKTSGASATLTLKANGSIAFNNSIIESTGSGNALNVVGWANFDGTGNDGNITSYGTILANGGNISLVGGLDDGANGGVAGDGIGDNYADNTIVLQGASLNAGGGNILINGSSTTGNGIVVGSSGQIKTAGSGNITIRGIGTAVGYGWAAGTLLQASTVVQAQNGTINITGESTVATGQGVGVIIQSGTQISTSGTSGGNINITGTRTGSGNNYARGIEIDDDTSAIYTVNGNITLNGTSSTSTSGVDSEGIYLNDGADIYSTGSGIINLNGTATGTTGIISDFYTAGANTSNIGNASGTGSINFNTNTIDLTNTGTLVKTLGTVTVKPRTASTTIGLGGGSGVLNLTDAELGYFSAGTFIIGNSLAGTGDINVTTWDLSGKTHNVELYGNDIDLGGITLGTGNFLAYAMDNAAVDLGTLNVSSAITKSLGGSSNLNLLADKDITIGAAITASTGVLNFVANADRDADHDGAILISNTSVATNGGYAVLGGGSGTLWGADGIKGTADDATSTGADNIAAWGNSILNVGVNIVSSTINTGAGDLFVKGMGYSNGSISDLHGIWINASTIRTTSGKIYLTGNAGIGTVNNGGITLQNGSLVTTATGKITASGTSSAISGGYNNYGINILSSSKFESTGTGASAADILLSGYNYSTSGGLSLNDGNISTVDGDIQIKSYAGTASSADNIDIINTSTIESKGDGNITIETAGGTSGSNAINLFDGAVQKIGHASMTGIITLITNVLDNIEATDIIQTLGAIYIKPADASTSIGLGGGSGTLNLTDTELASINAGTKLVIGNSISGIGDIDLDSWNLSGKTYSVEIYGNDIDLGGLTLGTGDFLAYAMDNAAIDLGTLTVSAATTKSIAGSSNLKLSADKDIVFTAGPITASTGSLNVVLNSDRDNDSDGAINMTNSNIITNGGYAVLGGGSGALGGTNGILGDGDGTGADDVAAKGNTTYIYGTSLNNSDITTNGGQIILRGIGTSSGAVQSHGVILTNGSQLDAATGAIKIYGTGGSTGTNGKYGIYLNGAGSGVTSSGDILLVGTGASTGNSNDGIRLNNGANVTGTGAGKIELLVTGGNSTTLLNAVGTASSIGGALMTGAITLTADTIAMDLLNVRTSGTATIKPYQSNVSLSVGSTTGTFALSDAELNMLSVGKLVIGDSTMITNSGDMVVDSWDLSSKSYDVDLYANDITFQDTDATVGVDYAVNLGSGNFSAWAQDRLDSGILTTNAAILKSVAGNSTLSLRADQDIIINASSPITASVGSLNVVLNSDRDGDQSGVVSITSSALTTNGGYFVAGGGSGNLGGIDGILGNGDGTGADDVAAWGITSNGVTLSGANITTGTGSIYITGHGADGVGTSSKGVSVVAGTISTTSGDITIKGTGGNASAGANYGLYFGDPSLTTKVTSNSGKITLYGRAQGTGLYNTGIYLQNAPIIESTGSATIDITAIGATASDVGLLTAAGATIGGSSASGNITLNTDIINLGLSTDIRTAGTIIVKPYTASTSIGLGGGAGTLNLDDTELGYFTAGNLIIGDSVSGKGDIAVTSWDLSGKTHNVELYGNDIDLAGLTLGTGNFTAYAMDNAAVDLGTLTVSSTTTKSVSGTSSLVLRADKDIVFNNSANITASGSGVLNTVLNADRDADKDGAISLDTSSITTNDGYVVLGGGSGNLGGIDGILGNGDGTGADDVAAYGNSTYAAGITGVNFFINSGAGNIFMLGNASATTSSSGINLYSAYFTTANGNISLVGNAANSAGNGSGLNFGYTTIVSTGNGKIDLLATTNNTTAGSTAKAISILNGNQITSNTGDINITGTVLGNGGDAIALTGPTSANVIKSSAGAIKLTATGGTSGSALNITGTNTIGQSTDTNNITLKSDTMVISGTASVLTQGNIYILPFTDSTSIGLGGGAGTLNLDDSELAAFNGTGKLIIGNAASATGDIAVQTWDLSAKTYTTEIYGNDIDLGGLTLGTSDFTAYAMDNAAVDLGTLTVSAPIAKSVSGNSSLILRADKDIVFNSGANITATTGSINTILNADRDADQDGAISISSSAITTNGGYAVLGGGSGTLGGTNGILGDGDGTGADDVAAYGNSSYVNGITLNNGDISTGAGKLIMNGHGYNSASGDMKYGISMLNDAYAQTTSGDIIVKGTAGNGSGNNKKGIVIDGAGTGIAATTSGKIDITGTGNGTGNDNYGLSIGHGAVVSTNSGALTMLAQASTTAGADYGFPLVLFDGGNILSTSGTINITALSPQSAGIVTSFSDGMIGGATDTGDINIISNYGFGGDTTRVQTTGKVTLKSYTAGISIGIAGGSGTMQYTNASLNAITAGTLIIGDTTTQTGDINVGNWNISGNTYNVELYGNDIALNGLTLGSGNFTAYSKNNGGDLGDLTIGAAITKAVAGTSTLDLRADNNISDAGFNIISSSGPLNMILTSDYENNAAGTTSFGATTVTSAGGNITINKAVTATGNLAFNAGTGIFTSGSTIAVGSHDLSITADDAVLGGTLSGTGDLLIQPSSATRIVEINHGIANGTNLNLSSNELGYLQNGWGSITIGNNNSIANMNIGANTWTDPLTLKAATKAIYGNQNFTTDGALTTLGGTFALNGYSITTAGGDVSLQDTFTPDGGTISTNTGDFNMGTTGSIAIGSGGGLTINTNGGNIDLTSITQPSTSALGTTITLNAGAGAIHATGNINTSGSIDASADTITLDGVLGGTNALDDLTLITDNLAIGGSIIGTGSLVISPKTLSRAINLNYGSSGLFLTSTELSYLQNGWNDVTIGSALGTGTITLGSNTWNDPIIFQTGSAGNIAVAGAQTGSGDSSLTFNGQTTLSSDLTTANQNISLNGETTVSVDTTINAGTAMISTGSTLAAGTHNLTLISDLLDIGGALTNSGLLTLKPYTNNTIVGLGGGSGTFNLTDTELGYISAGTLAIGSTASTGDVNINTWNLSTKSHNVQIFGNDMNVAGITMGSGDVTLYAIGGGIRVSAASTSNSSGNLNLLSAYDIQINSDLTNSGSGQINLFAGWDAASAITTPALFNRDNVDLALTARDITIGTGGRISSSGTGTAVLLATTGNFVNNSSSGANALQTTSGRYLVYAKNPTGTVKGGLTAKNWYNMDYNSNPESDITGTSSRFVFQYQPTLTLTANDITIADPASAIYTYSNSALVTGDLLADALSGTGSFALGALSGNTRSIIFTAGSLTSPNGYALAFANGVMTISGTPSPAPPAPPPSSSPIPPATPVLNDTVLNHSTNITKVSVIESSDNSGNQTPINTESDASNAALKGKSVDCLVSDNAGCVIN